VARGCGRGFENFWRVGVARIFGDEPVPSLDQFRRPQRSVHETQQSRSFGVRRMRLPMLIRRSLDDRTTRPHVKIHCEDLCSRSIPSESTGPRSDDDDGDRAGFRTHTAQDGVAHLIRPSFIRSSSSFCKKLEEFWKEKAGEMLWNAEARYSVRLQSIRLQSPQTSPAKTISSFAMLFGRNAKSK